MNYIEEAVTSFRVFAKEILEGQVADLKHIENSLLISGKIARFSVFNTHLHTLQRLLDEKIKVILNKQDVTSLDIHAELAAALNNARSEYVNEYMCSSFLKNGNS